MEQSDIVDIFGLFKVQMNTYGEGVSSSKQGELFTFRPPPAPSQFQKQTKFLLFCYKLFSTLIKMGAQHVYLILPKG